MPGTDLLPKDWRSRVEKTGDAYGLDYVVLVMRGGYRNGYVRVPEGHPWFGLRYWDGTDGYVQPVRTAPPFLGIVDRDHPDFRDCVSIAQALNAHGGITFDGERPNESCPRGWWFGFDCSHICDAKDPDLMSAEWREMSERLGLDDFPDPCATVKDLYYVEDECIALARQLADAAVPDAEVVDGELVDDREPS